nr:hypothetical protein Iba_chr14aCG14000 [Ipomoea batatas]GME03043.1 hypothetical protein Iba_scaffold412CG0020 [Ipomoea batatas]GME03046.1 hypothetical protein Iba_scaffold415CG0010 [Ipomoea batatas]
MDSQHAKRDVIAVPPRGIHMADGHGLRSFLPILAHQRRLENSGVSLLAVAVEHRVRVGQAVTSHHLPGRNLPRTSHNRVIPQRRRGVVGHEFCGHDSDLRVRSQDSANRIQHRFQRRGAEFRFALHGRELAVAERLFHGSRLRRGGGEGEEDLSTPTALAYKLGEKYCIDENGISESPIHLLNCFLLDAITRGAKRA